MLPRPQASPNPVPPPDRIPVPARLTVGGVVLLAGAILVTLIPGRELPLRGWMVWTLAFLAGEIMWLRTPTGRGTVSMASTFHLAAVVAVAPPVVVPAALAARLVSGTLLRQAWYKTLFNAGQVTLAAAAATTAYAWARGPSGTLDGSGLPGFIPAFALAGLVYTVVNLGLVSGILALLSAQGLLAAWRENFGSRVEIASTIGLLLLAPVVAVTVQVLGEGGIVAFLLPLAFIRELGRHALELEEAQRALISTERMAAKGEMAASVGHELNNYLSVLWGHLQMIERIGDRTTPEGLRDRLQKMSLQVSRMTTLSKGLMDFSKLESRPAPTDICALVRETIEFLRPQNRLDGIQIDTELDSGIGRVVVDPAQIQQAIMNLVLNAADAMNESEVEPRRLLVAARGIPHRARLEIVVEDTGPGLDDTVRERIFEPGFTTKSGGHGFGLPVVYRIVSNHEGRILAEDVDPHGTRFRIQLPLVDGLGLEQVA